MQIVDPRLIRYAHATKTYLGLSVAIGLAQTILLIAQAVLLAGIITRAFLYRASLGAVASMIMLLALVFVLRAALAWASEVVAHRTSADVKSQLRRLLLDHVVRLGPRWLAGERSGELAALATRGVDALDGYFARYIPQLILAALVPLAICVQLVAVDWLSALIVVVTVPLIPALMVVVGGATKRKVDTRWQTIQSLAHHFLDVLSGLGTLAAFGRSKDQVSTIQRMSEEQRRAGLASLRVAFLSSLVLELVAAIAIALVAVGVSLRVLGGGLDLETALLVVILAPEAYFPVRRMATQFHANAEGLGAAEQVFAVLTKPAKNPAVTGTRRSPDPAHAAVRFENVTVLGADRAEPLLDSLTLELAPGRFTGIVAPSGAGKSTMLELMLALIRPDAGRVRIGEVDLATVDATDWRSQVGWLPQEPMLFAGTVAENIALAYPDAPIEAIKETARAAAVDVPLDLPIGERGVGISSGQRRRIALARALLGDPSLLLLDEPTESVDPETEAAVFDALRHGMAGKTVVVVTHRPALLQLCHHVVRLEAAPAFRLAERVREEVPA